MISYDEIDDGLFLGSRSAAEDNNTLIKLGVTHVLTVDSQPLRQKFDDISYFHLHAFDEPETDLISHFDETFNFISEANQRKFPCLIHCFVGMSRSATILIAYLMKKNKATFEETLRQVQAKRNQVCPNSGFASQLYLFEIMGWEIKNDNLQYRLLQLMKLSRIFLKSKDSDVLKRYCPSSAKINLHDKEYKCRMCRAKLFSSHNVLPHFIGQPIFWDDIRWLKYPNVDHSKLCQSGIFVEPISWMLPCFDGPQGKILCHRCQAKLGSFNFSGLACKCGQEIFPGIHIVESKVDISQNILNTLPSVHNCFTKEAKVP